MKQKICRKDRNGIQLREGDIVAETNVGEEIWEGKGIVRSRPLGIVVVYPSMNANSSYLPEETDKYNIIQIRRGVVELNGKTPVWMDDGTGYCELHLSRYDGNFYAWDNIEKIGSIYDLSA